MPRKKKAEFEIHAKDRSKAGITRAEKRLDRLGKRTKAFAKLAGGALAVFGGARALRGFSRMVGEANKTTDALAKQARTMDINIASLQAYRLQAQLTGTSNEVLDKSIVKLNRNVGDMVNGLLTSSSTVPRAFETIGLGVDDFRDRKPEEVFEMVVDGIQKLPTAAERSSIAMQVFGRSGSEMLNLIAEGGEGLRQARNDIEAMGLAIDSIDARKVEIANDEMTRLEHISGAVKQRIGVELTPVLYAFTNSLVESGKEGQGFGDRIADGVETAVTWLDRLVSFFGIVKNGWQTLFSFTAGFWAGVVSKIAGGVATVSDKMADILTKNGTFLQKMVNGVAQGVQGTVNLAIDGINKMTSAAMIGLNGLIGVASALPGVKKIVTAAIPKIAPVTIAAPSVQSWVDGFDATYTGAKDLSESSGQLSKAFFEEGKESAKRTADAFNNLFDADGGNLVRNFRNARTEIDKLAVAAEGKGGAAGSVASLAGGGGGSRKGGAAGAVRSIGDAAAAAGEEAAQSLGRVRDRLDVVTGHMSNAIDDFVETGKLSFKGFAESLIKDLIRIQLKAQVFNLLGIGGGGIMGGLLGAIPGLNGLGISRAVPVFAGGGSTGSGARSGGVDGKGGFPAILHPNETVVDHSRGQGAGGNVTINQTVQITETVPEGMARQIAEAGKNAALMALKQIKQRGGRRAAAY